MSRLSEYQEWTGITYDEPIFTPEELAALGIAGGRAAKSDSSVTTQTRNGVTYKVYKRPDGTYYTVNTTTGEQTEGAVIPGASTGVPSKPKAPQGPVTRAQLEAAGADFTTAGLAISKDGKQKWKQNQDDSFENPTALTAAERKDWQSGQAKARSAALQAQATGATAAGVSPSVVTGGAAEGYAPPSREGVPITLSSTGQRLGTYPASYMDPNIVRAAPKEGFTGEMQNAVPGSFTGSGNPQFAGVVNGQPTTTGFNALQILGSAGVDGAALLRSGGWTAVNQAALQVMSEREAEKNSSNPEIRRLAASGFIRTFGVGNNAPLPTQSYNPGALPSWVTNPYDYSSGNYLQGGAGPLLQPASGRGFSSTAGGRPLSSDPRISWNYFPTSEGGFQTPYDFNTKYDEFGNPIDPADLVGLARGGIIRRPSYVVDAATGQVTAMVAEQDPEAIVPLGRGGMIDMPQIGATSRRGYGQPLPPDLRDYTDYYDPTHGYGPSWMNQGRYNQPYAQPTGQYGSWSGYDPPAYLKLGHYGGTYVPQAEEAAGVPGPAPATPVGGNGGGGLTQLQSFVQMILEGANQRAGRPRMAAGVGGGGGYTA